MAITSTHSRSTHSSDQALVAAYAGGDDRAATELFRRHHARAVREARSRARTPEAGDDAVSAAFHSVFRAIRRGVPVEHFRSYLLTAVRNQIISQARPSWSGEVPAEHLGTDLADQELSAGAEQSMSSAMRRALAALPERQQVALWSAEVDAASYDEIGESLSIGANAVAALTLRARRSLRAAYVAEVVGGGDVHEWVRIRLDDHARDRLSPRSAMVVEFHLAECADCRDRDPAAVVMVRSIGLGPALVIASVGSPFDRSIASWRGRSAGRRRAAAAVAVAAALGAIGTAAAAGPLRSVGASEAATASTATAVTPTTSASWASPESHASLAAAGVSASSTEVGSPGAPSTSPPTTATPTSSTLSTTTVAPGVEVAGEGPTVGGRSVPAAASPVTGTTTAPPSTVAAPPDTAPTTTAPDTTAPPATAGPTTSPTTTATTSPATTPTTAPSTTVPTTSTVATTGTVVATLPTGPTVPTSTTTSSTTTTSTVPTPVATSTTLPSLPPIFSVPVSPGPTTTAPSTTLPVIVVLPGPTSTAP